MTKAITFFGTALRISCLASVDQVNRKTCLICNSSEVPDASTPLENASTYKGAVSKSIQFGAFLARILQQILDADPADGPVWMSKWDILDAFHQCNLRPSDVRNFAYAVPPLLSYPSVLLCIDLVLSVGWVKSSDFFFAVSETVTDNTNGYSLDPASAFVVYPHTHGA